MSCLFLHILILGDYVNTLQFSMHPRIKNEFIQNDLNLLSLFIEDEMEKDLTTDQLYDMLETLKIEIDTLKEY
jgi:hypothetical protein